MFQGHRNPTVVSFREVAHLRKEQDPRLTNDITNANANNRLTDVNVSYVKTSLYYYNVQLPFCHYYRVRYYYRKPQKESRQSKH